MELMQESSTDKRLEGLSAKIDQRFAQVDHNCLMLASLIGLLATQI
jgi:hypothetical protein